MLHISCPCTLPSSRVFRAFYIRFALIDDARHVDCIDVEGVSGACDYYIAALVCYHHYYASLLCVSPIGLNYLHVCDAGCRYVPGRDTRGLIYPILSYPIESVEMSENRT